MWADSTTSACTVAAIAVPPGSSSWTRCLLPPSGPHLRSQQLQQARVLLFCNHVLPRIGSGGQGLRREAAAACCAALHCREEN